MLGPASKSAQQRISYLQLLHSVQSMDNSLVIALGTLFALLFAVNISVVDAYTMHVHYSCLYLFTTQFLVLPQTAVQSMDSSAVIALGTLFALSLLLLLVLTVVVVVLALMLKRARTGSEATCTLYV